jgi:hypothetical protein
MRVKILLTAAFAAAALLGAGPMTTAAAAPPSANPFAGTYSGIPPGVQAPVGWNITISDKGDVSGSVHVYIWPWYEDGTLVGRVDGAGQMSGRGSWTFITESPGYWVSSAGKFRFKASVGFDSDGNLVGTTDDGTDFVWYRQ